MTAQSSDPYRLQRFVDAQASVYAQVVRELRAARKMSHWMWFIFPQVAGLGSSPIAQRYAISARKEALAYIGHPVLGDRLRECTKLVNAAPPNSTLDGIFGYPDNLKFRSSMTLFHAAAPEESEFSEALDRWAAGEPDPLTLALLAEA